jgi:uncharacterized protein YqgV (UPF0045/DUF77 family)
MKKILFLIIILTLLMFNTGCQKPKKDPMDLSNYNLNKLTTNYEIESNTEIKKVFADIDKNIEFVIEKNNENNNIEIRVKYRIDSVNSVENACQEVAGIFFGTYPLDFEKFNFEELQKIQEDIFNNYFENLNIRVVFRNFNEIQIASCRIQDMSKFRYSTSIPEYKDYITELNKKQQN